MPAPRRNRTGRQQWRCWACGDLSEAPYDVCWNCGATLDGTRDPEFHPDSISDDRPSPLRWRLSRAHAIWLIGLPALLWLFVLYLQGQTGWAALLAILLAAVWLLAKPYLHVLMKQDLLITLAEHHQEHLLAFWDQLDHQQQRQLADEIRAIDFDSVARLHASGPAGQDWAALARQAQSPVAFRLDSNNPFTPRQARQRGEAALRAGQVGAILVAGGQGTRLGFDHPKGMFPIGPVSKAPLFRILFEKLLAARRRYGAAIPLYLMTSPATHEETVDYLTRHEHFGLPADEVHVFCQGVMPAVDQQTGRLLLAAPGRLALSPDGHGGMLAALDSSGGLADLRRRGIEQLFYFQVDNPLVAVCDPEFLGYHLLSHSEMSTQVVAKRTPRDNVGNVVQIDGRVQILEYSDLNPLPDEIVLRKEADGSPVFWAGNIGVHAIDVVFLDRVANQSDSLPFHVARKKVSFIDEQGQVVEPTAPNAMKFERFIFDLLPAAKRSIVMEVDEAAIFAPVKNAAGEKRDSPETVQAQMMALYRRWLRAAGVQVADDVPIEISPLVALDADEAQQRLSGHSPIEMASCFGPDF